MEQASPSSPLDLSRLTPGEREVLEHARSGATAMEVARALGLSEATVRTHLSHIYQKVGVRGRVELVARLQGAGAVPTAPQLQAAAIQQSPVGLVAVLAGCAATVIGMVYEAWWTIAFLIGGVAVGLLAQRQMASARLVAIGATISGSALLAGMSIFLLYGSTFGGTPWLVAAIASIGSAAILLVVARRLLRRRPAPGAAD